MGESAESLAASRSSRRNVTIEISNLTNNYCLIDPKVHLEGGDAHIPPAPTVRPAITEVCNFGKTGGIVEGAVGVLTYNLLERSRNDYIEMLAIMFSVPYDQNVYKNWFAVGIFKRDTEVNEALYKTMYYDKEQREFVREEACGSGITYEGKYLDVKATMSPLGRAMMKVEVWDKLFIPRTRH